jgi:hypothetical protein
MDIAMKYALQSAVIGAGATLFMDAWMLLRRRVTGAPLPDYGLVGRWFAYMSRGRFRHERIAASPPVRGERLIGWMAHYAVGIAFAALLLALWGIEWTREPTLLPALAVGLGSIIAPFLLMQPGMGAGIAASRMPRPAAARLQSLATHAVFGLGLYAAAVVSNRLLS